MRPCHSHICLKIITHFKPYGYTNRGKKNTIACIDMCFKTPKRLFKILSFMPLWRHVRLSMLVATVDFDCRWSVDVDRTSCRRLCCFDLQCRESRRAMFCICEIRRVNAPTSRTFVSFVLVSSDLWDVCLVLLSACVYFRALMTSSSL